MATIKQLGFSVPFAAIRESYMRAGSVTFNAYRRPAFNSVGVSYPITQLVNIVQVFLVRQASIDFMGAR